MITRTLLIQAALLAAGGASLRAQAPAARNHLRDKLQLSASAAVLSYATDLRFDRSNGSPGTSLDPEEDLGMPATVARAHFGLRLRPSPRHEIEFGYLLARRSGNHVLTDTIVVGDTTFAAGLRMQSDINSDNASLTYRFAFHVRERHEVGATIGLGALMFNSTIKAVAGATAGGPDTTIVPFASSGNKTVPTGALGLYGRMRAGRAWYLEADARALFFEIERVTVRVIDIGAAARYFVNDWLALQAGYGYSKNSAEVDPRPGASRSFAGHFQYGLHTFRLGIVGIK